MKEIYFVAGAPGTCLHYVCCLIRLLYNPNFYNNQIISNKYGLYDEIFKAHFFFEFFSKTATQISKEHQAELAFTMLKDNINKELTQDYYIEKNIIPIHYGNKETMDLILNIFPNSKIIYITYDEHDIEQINLNYFVKIILYAFLEKNKISYTRLVNVYRKCRNSIIFNKEKFLNLNVKENKLELLELINEVTELKISKHFKADIPESERLLTLKFKDLSLNQTVDKLSAFSNMPISNELIQFSNEFKKNQPTIDSLDFFINEMKNNDVTNFVYNAINNNINWRQIEF